MGTELLGNLLETTTSFTFYMNSGRVWSFKSEDVINFEFENGVIAIKLRKKKNKAFFIMDKEIEAVSLILKEEEKSE